MRLGLFTYHEVPNQLNKWGKILDTLGGTILLGEDLRFFGGNILLGELLDLLGEDLEYTYSSLIHQHIV